jgi:hypothetical protein
MRIESEQTAPPDPTSHSVDASSNPVAELPFADVLARANSLEPENRLRLIAAIWASLPSWHPASPIECERLQLLEHLDDFDAGRIDKFPWKALQRMIAGEPQRPPTKVYSAPRRFDLATILIVTFAYSLLFGAMRALSFPPMVSVVFAGFISLVGVGQAFLFGGNKPRTASLVVGAFFYTLAVAATWLINGPRLYATPALLMVATYTIIGGAILGYLAGLMVAGVFLVADKLRNWYSRRHAKPDQGASTGAQATALGGDSPWTS